MRKPLKLGEPIGSQVAVRIEETRLCRRYQALLIRDVKPGPAPGWMQRRLRLVGTRPIDAIVDITNYVLFEWGQPLHAFDYDRLVARAGGTAPTIVVRLARPGEKLATLDGKERELTAEMLVIADTVGPIALAGVMGGLDTMVTTSTKNLLLESASFDPVNIRRTARALDLHSESSYRFSRGVHPEVVQPAAERAAALLSQFAGGTVCQGVVEQYPSPLPPQQIDLSLSQVERVLGIPIPAETAAKVLRSLEFGVNIAGDVLNVTTPPSRLDIQDGPADLIEELARIHGYDHLPATLLSDRLPRQQTNRSLVLEEQTRDILVAAGLTEVMSYSLTLPEREKPILGERSYLTLANPVSSDRSVLRQSVLASILEQTARNLKHREQVKIFEIGQVYEPLAGEKLPRESCRLAVVLVGPRQAETWSEPGVRAGLDFFDLKGVLETFLQELHIPQSSFRAAKPSFLHPGRAAELQGENISFGFLGQLHPALNEIYELGKREIYVADLDLDALLAQVPMRYKYEPIAEFPPVRQDVALVVDENIEAAKLEAEIRAGGGDLLKRVRLFDVYRGDNLPVGTKSLAFALTYQAHDRTLTDKEVAKIHGKIVNRLEHKLGAKLRT
jgi:phenylalanyl-tRNA synthetase beta chain